MHALIILLLETQECKSDVVAVSQTLIGLTLCTGLERQKNTTCHIIPLLFDSERSLELLGDVSPIRTVWASIMPWAPFTVYVPVCFIQFCLSGMNWCGAKTLEINDKPSGFHLLHHPIFRCGGLQLVLAKTQIFNSVIFLSCLWLDLQSVSICSRRPCLLTSTFQSDQFLTPTPAWTQTWFLCKPGERNKNKKSCNKCRWERKRLWGTAFQSICQSSNMGYYSRCKAEETEMIPWSH